MQSRQVRKLGRNSCYGASLRLESAQARRWAKHRPHPALSPRRQSRESPAVRVLYAAAHHLRADWQKCDATPKAQALAVLLLEFRWHRRSLPACSCATSLPPVSDPSCSWLGPTREPGARATSLPPYGHSLPSVLSIPSESATQS